MNTTTTSLRTRFALGTASAGLCLGAAACGTTTVDPAGSVNQQSQSSPRTNQHQSELDALEAKERARVARGDKTAEHPPGSFHADTYCRRVGNLAYKLICSSPEPTQSSARPGSYKYPDLIVP